MKKFLKSDKALCRTPSAALDDRIMLAARIAAARNRSRHNFRRYFAISGAAAALLIGGAVYIHMPQPAARNRSQEELLAMNDWSKFEQESYNLALQLYSEGDIMLELTDIQNI